MDHHGDVVVAGVVDVDDGRELAAVSAMLAAVSVTVMPTSVIVIVMSSVSAAVPSVAWTVSVLVVVSKSRSSASLTVMAPVLAPMANGAGRRCRRRCCRW